MDKHKSDSESEKEEKRDAKQEVVKKEKSKTREVRVSSGEPGGEVEVHAGERGVQAAVKKTEDEEGRANGNLTDAAASQWKPRRGMQMQVLHCRHSQALLNSRPC